MNEYKIQLESKEDFAFLKQEFLNFANNQSDSASSVPEALKQQFFDRVFSIVSENIQVNGVDWAEVAALNSTVEAVNTELVGKLQELQQDTEALLNQTIELRHQVPKEIKSSYLKHNEEFMKRLESEAEIPIELTAEDAELCTMDTSITPHFYSGKLSSGLSHLVHLQKSIPDIVAKLDRARAVITEEGGKRLDQNSQILHRHRRLSRQFDLASKIGGF